ncbi:PDZ domain-containing protein [Bacillus sp. SIMBA_069]
MELRKYLYIDKKIGDKVKIIYYRDGKKETTEVKLSSSEI